METALNVVSRVSNPLIRPNDPRFQQPPLRDAAGGNLFADADAPVPAQAADGEPLPARVMETAPDNLFAPPAPIPGGGPVYRPQYVATHAHRGILLLGMSIAGLIGAGATTLVFSGQFLGLLGLVTAIPAGFAWIGGRADLRAMREGAMDPGGRALTRVATWLGIGSLVLHFAAVVATAVFLEWIVLPFVQEM